MSAAASLIETSAFFKFLRVHIIKFFSPTPSSSSSTFHHQPELGVPIGTLNSSSIFGTITTSPEALGLWTFPGFDFDATPTSTSTPTRLHHQGPLAHDRHQGKCSWSANLGLYPARYSLKLVGLEHCGNRDQGKCTWSSEPSSEKARSIADFGGREVALSLTNCWSFSQLGGWENCGFGVLMLVFMGIRWDVPLA